MATIPYMPLYTSDYLSDTVHLSTLEHGAYILLIMAYWQRGESFRANDERTLNERLARVARLSNEEWNSVKTTLQDFFEISETEWRHNRIEAELSVFRLKSEQARQAGMASAEKRRTNSKQTFNGRSTGVKRTLNERSTITDNRQQITDNNINTGVPNGTLVQNDIETNFEKFWKLYPRHENRKKAKAIWERKKLDSIAEVIIADVIKRKEKHLPWQDKQFIPHATTYLNGERWQDEVQNQQAKDESINPLQEKIKNLYREILEPLTHSFPLHQWTSEDIKNLQARIDENLDLQTEEAWREFFMHLKTLKKLTGEQKMPNGKPFKVSLSYIVREKNFADICNGLWDNE